MTLSGCGGQSGPGASPTPSPTPQVSLTLAPDAPQTYEAAQASANRLMLTPEEVPTAGTWKPGGPVASDDFRQTVCGVDTEPFPPAGSFVGRRIGPHNETLFQSVRPVGATQARATFDALAKAVPTCTSDTRKKPEGNVTYEVQQLKLASADVIGYKQRQTNPKPSGTMSNMWAYMVYFVAKDSLVTFTTYSAADPAEPLLDAAIAAVRAKAG